MITLFFVIGFFLSLWLAIMLYEQEFRSGFYDKKHITVFVFMAIGSWVSILLFAMASLFIVASYCYKRELKTKR